MFATGFAQKKTCSTTLEIDHFSRRTLGEQLTVLRVMNHSPISLGIWHNVAGYFGDFVSIYLVSKFDTFKFKCTISILNPDGKKLFTKEYCGAFEDQIAENHFSLMPRQKLLSTLSGYLFDDKFTLLCEIEAIEENPTIRKDFVNLSYNYESMLTDGKFSDFTLTVVFAAMFEHDCEEKRQNKVNITDMDEDVCEEMLNFVYSGKVKQLDRFAMELLVVADKYQLPSLKSICCEYMCDHLSVESVANVLILADLHRTTSLKAKCLEYICANVDQVESSAVSADGWKVLGTNAKLLQELFIYSAKQK